ncbi:MAG: Crp/Fnr family transcriptional regulator [Minwuiales bacterium]|nr:Crp/Fnr family transcriptional regulator [Minwuiales bacterium]
MAQSEESLRGINLFADLADSDLDAIAMRCRWRRFQPDQHIIGHLDDTQDVFFVVTGQVQAKIFSMSGKEVTFRDIRAGEMFGEFSAIDGEPRSSNVVATAESLIAFMPAQVFWDVLMEYPKVAAVTLKKLTAQIRMLSERVFEFSTLAVKNRIHAELLRLARDGMQSDNTAVISPAPTHADLASRVSTHREAVTRELNHLSRGGLIERRSGKLVIHDVERLSRLVQEVLGE